MKVKNETQICNTLSDLPNKEYIGSIERGVSLKIVFSPKINKQREQIGKEWKKELPNHQVAIHTIQPEINIIKLITENEIENNQIFFEQCAKDYRDLSNRLIRKFAKQNKVKIDPIHPMNTLNPSGVNGYEQIGTMGDWRYNFHGFHCAFTNLKTHQHIETPLAFGLEFGELDPYFFSIFINSTSKYKPLPCMIYDDYEDGKRILEEMLHLGKFERINSNVRNSTGIVVKDRNKVEIVINEDIIFIPQEEIKFKLKKLSFWQKIKLKLKRNI